MKKMVLLFLSLFLFAGCASSEYISEKEVEERMYIEEIKNTAYEEGYNDGYNDCLVSSCETENYEEEYLEFQSTIVTLMYDFEYETVEKILKYYPEAVKPALENEFGTDDIATIIDYLEKNRTEQPIVLIGKCKCCGEDVYSDNVVHMASIGEPYEMSYAHKECVE